jgi:hypothetical protein
VTPKSNAVLTGTNFSYTIGEEVTLPGWVIKLARRLLGLTRGYRYTITLTLTTRPDWTIRQDGPIEN